MTVTEMVHTIARDARVAARNVRTLTRGQKDRALMRLVGLLDQERENVAAVNAADVARARENGLSTAMIDRLTLSPEVIHAMIDGLKEVAALPDPVGEVLRSTRRPNGLTVGRCRIPLGVIGFIYESRPNVTVDAAALCVKSGNAVILKGGSEALRSNLLLAELIQKALEQTDIPAAAVQVVPTPDRTAVQALLALEEEIDLIIPRGGEGLIRHVVQNSAIPVLKHYKGVCHVYVDRSADLAMAEEISFNAKVQRPGVCNAMETLLVHEGVAAEFLPSMVRRFEQAGVELRGCEKTRQSSSAVKAATREDWPEEFHDLILAVKVVPGMDMVENITAVYLKMLKNPRAGYGKHMNPCMDCHTLMFRLAGEKMREHKFDFIFSGEVLRQRPMSQTRASLQYVAKHSGLADLIVRPLTARRLPESVPEKKGWVDRSRLLNVAGRSRKPQIALAAKYGITQFPTPAGGCLLLCYTN